MQPLGLARAAARAEQLRLRRLARRLARRAALFAVAALLLACALLALHAAALIALAHHMPGEYAALCLAGIDVVLVLPLLLLVRRTRRPDREEREAGLLRDQALAPFSDGLAFARLLLRSDSLLRLLDLLARLLLSRRGPPEPRE